MICDLVADSVANQFDMHVKSSNTEVFALIFFVTFETIMDFLNQKQTNFNNFTFKIAKSLNIGYTNNTNTENEKFGNFMPLIEYTGINRNIIRDEINNADDKSEVNFIRWKQQNLTQNENFCNQIQNQAAVKLANEYGIQIVNNEAVIPIFCIFLDMAVYIVKTLYNEANLVEDGPSEYKINVLGLFDLYYSFDSVEDKEHIDFTPGIYMKLRSKSDLVATKED